MFIYLIVYAFFFLVVFFFFFFFFLFFCAAAKSKSTPRKEGNIQDAIDDGLYFLQERTHFWDSLGPLPPPHPVRKPNMKRGTSRLSQYTSTESLSSVGTVKSCKCCINRNIRERNFGHVRPAKIQIRLRIREVWSESSLDAVLIAKKAKFLLVEKETLLRLRGCVDWLDSSLDAHVRRHVFSRDVC